MTTTCKALITGGLIILLGVICYVYATFFIPSYAGYSGGGMSGLPTAFMILGGLGLMASGALLILGSVVFLWIRKSQKKPHTRN